HSEGCGHFGLGEPGRLAHLSQLMPPNAAEVLGANHDPLRLSLGTCQPRLPGHRLSLHVTPSTGCHTPSSFLRSARYSSYPSSATGLSSRYQRFHWPALSPATRITASRSTSKTNSRRISDRPAEPGRSSFRLCSRLPWIRPAEARAGFCQVVDRFHDPVGGGRILLTQVQEPLLDRGEQHDVPHTSTINHTLCSPSRHHS